jgi:hypothetical protein
VFTLCLIVAASMAISWVALIATEGVMSYLFHMPFVTVTPPSSWQRSQDTARVQQKGKIGRGVEKWRQERRSGKKDDTAQDLKAAHESNGGAKKEDDLKPAAINKKMDDATLKIKDPPKRGDKEEDETDDKKPAAKENVQHKKKKRNPRLPLHPNSTRLLPKSIGKSPNMDVDLEDT